MSKNMCKCPTCGFEFDYNGNNKTIFCEKCKSEIVVLRAVKYYESVNSLDKENKSAHGEDYKTVDMKMEVARSLIQTAEYDKAIEQLLECLNLTTTNYKVYMLMARALTKNYTDIKDTRHKSYLDKAVSVADLKGKQEIKSEYRAFYQKTRLTETEFQDFKNKNIEHKTQKLEGLLKGLIPIYMAKERSNKLMLAVFPILILIGAVLVVLGYMLPNQILMMASIVFIFGGFLLWRFWFSQKYMTDSFNGLLDIYDALPSFDVAEDQREEIIKLMIDLTKKYDDREPMIVVDGAMNKLVTFFIEIEEQKAMEIISNNKSLRDSY